MDIPEIRYAKAGDIDIAYEVLGDGPIDVVAVPGWATNIEDIWEDPRAARFNDRLASFSRLIDFDGRGTGLSARVGGASTLEGRMEDLLAVMKAVGTERVVLMGFWEGGPTSVLFAATYPERVSALVLYGVIPRFTWSPECPWAPTAEANEAIADAIEEGWGRAAWLDFIAPSLSGDDGFHRWWARMERNSQSPSGAAELFRTNASIDVSAVLPTIRVPTLVLHRSRDLMVPIESGRYVADRIPGARFVELSGQDHLYFVGDQDALVAEIQEFLTGVREAPEPDRVLATVLFTDIVGSTERAATLGDRRWRDLLEAHNGVVRRELARFRGREIDTAGDGFLATFDGPARAIRCAEAIIGAVRQLGLEVRTGVHTGEVELTGDKVGGIAVHIGARVAASAGAGEVLVSRTVVDLVAGSRLSFADRGARQLKGVPREWQLFSVTSDSAR
jgi:class 3 adenylate cyclase